MLQIGSQGDETKQLQAFLILHGFLTGIPDGAFGPNTKVAVCLFQEKNGLEADGVVGPATYDKLRDAGFRIAGAEYPFIPARWFNSGRGGVEIDLIVLHTTEGPKTAHRSRLTAEMFHEGKAQASAHYDVDPVDITQSVLDQDVAWHADHHDTNHRSIGIEQAGSAQQTPEDWADADSTAELSNVAKLCAKLCRRYGIPVVKLSVDELKAGGKGFCGHVDVTNAFNGGSGHRDPGPNYLWGRLLQMVQEELDLLGTPTP